VHLGAISIGYAVPRIDFDAVVHSVFHSAVNLKTGRSYRLLSLLASGQPDLPQGIRLNSSEALPFEGLRTGEVIHGRAGLLQFENFPLAIQLRGAQRWKCDLRALDIDPDKPAVSVAWEHVWDELNRQQKLSGAEIVADELFHSSETPRPVVTLKAGQAVGELVTATRKFDLADSTALRALIGLGSGLTPSGDDLLTGFLAGLWCTVRGKSERARFIASLGKRILRLSARTNDISRTYLYHAVHGQVSSLLADLAGAISRGEDPRCLSDSAKAAMQTGHSSGMDAVTGLMVGLITWNNNPARYAMTMSGG